MCCNECKGREEKFFLCGYVKKKKKLSGIFTEKGPEPFRRILSIQRRAKVHGS